MVTKAISPIVESRGSREAPDLDAIEQAVVVADLDGKITYWNRFAERLYGWRAEEVAGKSVAEITLPPEIAPIARDLLATIRKGASWSGELPRQRRDGSEFVSHTILSPLRVGSEITGVAGISVDALVYSTESALRLHERRTRALLRAIPDLIFRIRKDGTYTGFAGRSSKAVIGQSLTEVLPPEIAAQALEAIRRTLETQTVTTFAYELGDDQAFEARLSPSDGDEVVAAVRNVSAHMRRHQELDEAVAERTVELQRTNAALQALSQRLITIQDEERRHIARELHDHSAQLITALNLAMENCRREVPEVAAHVAVTGEIVAELARQVRDLSLHLRPPMLDELGLVPALESHIERFSLQTRLRIEHDLRTLPRLAPHIETTAYRVEQESLTNAARARATHVVVRVQHDGALHVSVEDDGVGFDPATVGTRHTYGVSGMRERALLAGGTFDIESSPGKGTRVSVTLPMEGREA